MSEPTASGVKRRCRRRGKDVSTGGQGSQGSRGHPPPEEEGKEAGDGRVEERLTELALGSLGRRRPGLPGPLSSRMAMGLGPPRAPRRGPAGLGGLRLESSDVGPRRGKAVPQGATFLV